MTVLLACPRRPGAGQAGFRLSFLSLPPVSLPPAMRGIDGKQLAFLSFPTFSWHDRGSTVPSNPSLSRRSLDVLVFLHFRKAALRTTVPSAVLCSEFFLFAPRRGRARPTNGHDLWPNLYSDFIHVAAKEGRRMHGGAPIHRIIRVWF